MSENIGIVGIGLLGTALAERLLAHGFRLVGFDVDESRGEALRSLGGAVAGALNEVFKTCRRVVLCLPNSEVVESVLRDAGHAIQSGAFILDTTTGDPERSVIVGRVLGQRGISYIDATVQGSSADVRKRDAVLMVGGDDAAVEQCSDLFDALGRRWFHVGPCGSGATMKLVVNLVLGLHRAVLAEGLALARACSLDLHATLAVMQSGAAWSRVMDTKGRKMIEHDFSPQARLSQHLKDVRLILNLGHAQNACLPLSDIHMKLLAELEAAGFGDEDNSAVIRAFEPQAPERRS
jgi:3-hydroxyisobutyrate dehydrogenase-like beta-hydroxyacid dehydrogenase